MSASFGLNYRFRLDLNLVHVVMEPEAVSAGINHLDE
jgi:hypothetical protein